MLVSIVIPTCNRTASLKRNLAALCPQLDSNCELIVVDDNRGGAHEPARLLCTQHPEARYLYNTGQHGPAAARNAGIGASSGEWVGFIDDDTIVAQDWVASLVALLKDTPDSTAGIEGATHPGGTGFWDTMAANVSGGMYLTSCIAYRRSFLLRAGLFDQTFEGRFCEDQDLALRMLALGQIPFAPTLRVTHQPHNVNLLRYLPDTPRRRKRRLVSELYFFLRHRSHYHTLRPHASFAAMWRAAALGNWSAFLRVPRAQILLHPLQALTFLLALIIEQVTTICLAPMLLRRFLLHNTRALLDIDPLHTARLLQTPHAQFDLCSCMAKWSLLRALLFPLLRRPTYCVRPVHKALAKVSTAGSPQVYVRIDDLFLEETQQSNQLLKALQRADIPFCAGVRGEDLCASQGEKYAQQIVDSGGCTAIHGFSHTGTFGPYASELLQLSSAQITLKVKEVLSLRSVVLGSPAVFIPPFNALSCQNIDTLAPFFDIICGGPESARFVGPFAVPVITRSSTLYFPSMPPYYGYSRSMPLLKPDTLPLVPICLTFHAQAEGIGDARDLIDYLEPIRALIRPWVALKEIIREGAV